MNELNQDPAAEEAEALVVLAFRNGPIETVHVGKRCPTCDSAPGYSRITDAEMKIIMKAAVDKLYTLLRIKAEDPTRYDRANQVWNAVRGPLGRARLLPRTPDPVALRQTFFIEHNRLKVLRFG